MKKKSGKEPTWDEIGKAIGTKIEKECKDGKCNSWKGYVHQHGGCGFFYFTGFIGAVIYYISTATSFWMGVLGFLKALIWPAFLVFELMKFLAL